MNLACEVRTKRSLDHDAQRLVALMGRIGFGRIERLHIVDGQPTFHPTPRVVREVKLGTERSEPARSHSADFALKRSVLELFAELQTLDNGVVALIEVRHGLPFRLMLEEVADV